MVTISAISMTVAARASTKGAERLADAMHHHLSVPDGCKHRHLYRSFAEHGWGSALFLLAKSCNYLDSNSLVEEVKSLVIVCERNAVTHLRSGFSSSRSFAA
jgi:hypothetical protein